MAGAGGMSAIPSSTSLEYLDYLATTAIRAARLLASRSLFMAVVVGLLIDSLSRR